MRGFFNRVKKRSIAANSRKKTDRRLQFEQFEARQLMTVNPIFNGPLGPAGPIGPVYDPSNDVPVAEGSINFQNGVVTIEGTDAHADKVKVYIHHRGNGQPDLLTVELGNINTPQVRIFDPTTVSQIKFNGRAGNDIFNNLTNISSFVLGGAGHDTLLGGRGSDSMWGEDGNDYLDGRAGHDLLLGGSGVDALFGDLGDDHLYGGSNVDRLFGGAGVDKLYGETGIDFLYGGAGLDTLNDTQSSNRFADYGPDVSPSASGFTAFDWFDRNLKDASLRSLVRLNYRDGVLNRADMLEVYAWISTDGVQSSVPFQGTVSTNEFSDLKALVSKKINYQNDTRFFAERIANGDRANARFQGASLGNLKAGVSGAHLTKLVGKWFKGEDLPEIVDAKLRTLRYEKAFGSLFVNGANYKDVDQGVIGDCYFIASLGEIALQHNSRITSMFSDNGDDTWSVRFFVDGKARYVTVNRMLPVFGNGFGAAWAAGWGVDNLGFSKDISDPTNELWVALAEKAYVQMNESGVTEQNGKNNYHGIEGGFVADAYAHIGGVEGTNLFRFNEGIMVSKLNAGQCIVLGTKDKTHPTVVPNHAYMVVGYNPETRMFSVFNPHGFNSHASDGSLISPVIEMSFAALKSNTEYWTVALV